MKMKKWPFVYVGIITAITYIPILLTVVYSFNASKLSSVWEGFSLKWYVELFQDRDIKEALINSLVLAVLSCLLAVFIGTAGALGMRKHKRKANDVISYLSMLPIMIPELEQLLAAVPDKTGRVKTVSANAMFRERFG